MRTFYEVSVAEEEDQRCLCGCGDSVKDDTVDVRWSLSPSRTWPAGLLQRQLSEERN
jgi:hypothetical protein